MLIFLIFLHNVVNLGCVLSVVEILSDITCKVS